MHPDLQSIAVEDLRLGMYVHLDMHWIRHPFARNHFLIQSLQQITTIRGLGVQTVRIRPSLCVNEPNDVFADSGAQGYLPESDGPVGQVAPAPSATFKTPSGGVGAADKQFNEAAVQLRNVMALVISHPDKAMESLSQLSQAMLAVADTTDPTYLRLMQDESRDKYTGHALNVTVLAVMLGKFIGLDSAALRTLCLGALMHDLGKMEIPEKVRHSVPFLNLVEILHYQEHVGRGLFLSKNLHIPSDIEAIIGEHHEHFDGSGFPSKLMGDRISYGARIVGLANRYDNLCNPPQRALALTPHEALRTMYSQEKTKFDPEIMALFIKMMGIYPPGTYVQLTDERYALVMSVRATQILKPNVLIYTPGVELNEVAITVLENMQALGVRRSLRPEQLPVAVSRYFSRQHRLSYFFERPEPTAPTTGAL